LFYLLENDHKLAYNSLLEDFSLNDSNQQHYWNVNEEALVPYDKRSLDELVQHLAISKVLTKQQRKDMGELLIDIQKTQDSKIVH
jgi:hypothetical protein